ncbi:MAG TPA: peptidylprolyl isomerase [Thermodesulfovibrionales bacterium]|nr:peptidylprolyl isomerase [Thermodesulfovibrionales bacterium]
MRSVFSIFVGLLLFALCLQGTSFAEEGKVVAKVGKKTITLADIDRVIGYADPEKQKMINSNPQFKEAVVRQYVQSMVVSDLAKKEGFDKKPDIKELLDFYADNYLANEYIKREVTGKIVIPEDEKKKYYEAHKQEFGMPETVRARHILIRTEQNASEEDKKKAKQKAEDVLRRLHAGEDFAKVASEVSEDPSTKAAGGDLGFFPRGSMVKSFEDAAFSLKPGEISGIVESPYGYHIIKVEEKKAPYTQPYDEVSGKIQQKLTQEKARTRINEFMEKATKDAGVEVFPSALTGETKK